MTGPEHYVEAERLLIVASDILAEDGEGSDGAKHILAEAQVHATLALAAATVSVGDGSLGFGGATTAAWQKATSS